MKRFGIFTMLVALAGAVALQAGEGRQALVVTASNTAQNQLLVYDTTGTLLQTISTQGAGGASGNAGGIMVRDGLLAVVNFGSQTVSIFQRVDGAIQFAQSIPTLSNPVSVAFGHRHLYVLGTNNVESHAISGSTVSAAPDGTAGLLKADASSAQVGVVEDQLIITEKSNVIETVNLSDGAVTGAPALVQNIPANVNAPFGLVTRDDNAYVTIAHADEISLVRDGSILTITPSVTQHAPCWLTLVGSFLYSSNSPSMSVSRYSVHGRQIVQEVPVAASFNGDPTDITSRDELLAVVDGSGPVSRLTIFTVEDDGSLTQQAVATINAPANGVAIFGHND